MYITILGEFIFMNIGRLLLLPLLTSVIDSKPTNVPKNKYTTLNLKAKNGQSLPYDKKDVSDPKYCLTSINNFNMEVVMPTYVVEHPTVDSHDSGSILKIILKDHKLGIKWLKEYGYTGQIEIYETEDKLLYKGFSEDGEFVYGSQYNEHGIEINVGSFKKVGNAYQPYDETMLLRTSTGQISYIGDIKPGLSTWFGEVIHSSDRYFGESRRDMGVLVASGLGVRCNNDDNCTQSGVFKTGVLQNTSKKERIEANNNYFNLVYNSAIKRSGFHDELNLNTLYVNKKNELYKLKYDCLDLAINNGVDKIISFLQEGYRDHLGYTYLPVIEGSLTKKYGERRWEENNESHIQTGQFENDVLRMGRYQFGNTVLKGFFSEAGLLDGVGVEEKSFESGYSIYYGDFSKGVKTGFGNLEIVNEDMLSLVEYSGDFQDNIFDGVGRLVNSSLIKQDGGYVTSISLGTYGHYSNGVLNNIGEMALNDTDRVFGLFDNGIPTYGFYLKNGIRLYQGNLTIFNNELVYHGVGKEYSNGEYLDYSGGYNYGKKTEAWFSEGSKLFTTDTLVGIDTPIDEDVADENRFYLLNIFLENSIKLVGSAGVLFCLWCIKQLSDYHTKITNEKNEKALKEELEIQQGIKLEEELSTYFINDKSFCNLLQNTIDIHFNIGISSSEISTKSAFEVVSTRKEGSLRERVLADTDKYLNNLESSFPHIMTLKFNGFKPEDDCLMFVVSGQSHSIYVNLLQGDQKRGFEDFLVAPYEYRASNEMKVSKMIIDLTTNISKFSLESITTSLDLDLSSFKTDSIHFDLDDLLEVDHTICTLFPFIKPFDPTSLSSLNVRDNNDPTTLLTGETKKYLKQYKEQREKLLDGTYLDRLKRHVSLVGRLKQYSFEVQPKIQKESSLTIDTIGTLYNIYYRVPALLAEYAETYKALLDLDKYIKNLQVDLLISEKNKTKKNEYEPSVLSSAFSSASAFTMYTSGNEHINTKGIVQSAYLRTSDYGSIINDIQGFIIKCRTDISLTDGDEFMDPALVEAIPLITYSLGESWRQIFTAKLDEVVVIDEKKPSFSAQTIPLHRSHGGFHDKDNSINETLHKEVQKLIKNFNTDYLFNIKKFFEGHLGIKSSGFINTDIKFIKFITDEFIIPNRLEKRETSEGSHTCIKIPELIINTRSSNVEHSQKHYVQTHIRLLMLEYRYEKWLNRNQKLDKLACAMNV
jgi:hypothetical protein